jgi:hypothetical protein
MRQEGVHRNDGVCMSEKKACTVNKRTCTSKFGGETHG